MGLIVYPVFSSKIPTAESSTTGEFLALEFETLDLIADVNGLPRFSAFGDQRALPPDFDGPPWKLDELLGPCGDWYSAALGRNAFVSLAKVIREHGPMTDRLEAPNEVVDELEDLAAELAVAEQAGVEFRLAIS